MPVTAEYADAIEAHAIKPIIRPSGTGPAVWGPGDLYNFLVTGKETNSAFFQFEAIVPTGGGPPPHSHSREDESFYVVSGELELMIGESTYRAKAGDFVFVPRGMIHTFKNVGDSTAVQLVTFVPAGMEGLRVR
jgi:quercetin dioxygenase-like cupin family protein